VPAPVADIALQNKAVVYDILQKTAGDTIGIIGADPRYLGGQTGLFAVLHTWGSAMTHHPHAHCLVPGGALTPDGAWGDCRRNFFLPVRVLSQLYRRLFLERLPKASAAEATLEAAGCLPFRLHVLVRQEGTAPAC
jgi:hypothetical protein